MARNPWTAKKGLIALVGVQISPAHPNLVDPSPLERAADVYADLEARQTKGHVLLIP